MPYKTYTLEVLRRLRAYKQPYMGLAELAEILGMSKQMLTNRRTRHPDAYPEPTKQLAQGPVWDVAEFTKWVRTGRLPANIRRKPRDRSGITSGQ